MTDLVTLADGRRVAYETYGAAAGRPLVWLHGFSDSRLTGAALHDPARRAGTRLLCPDRPGIGLSTGRLETLAACAPWLAGFLDALGLERVPLGGVSGGGPFVLACARFLPERVACALVVSGLGPVELGSAGMPAGQRLGIAVARRAPRPAASVLAAVAALGRASPAAFLALVRWQTGSADAAALDGSGAAATVVRPFVEAYRGGAGGVANELRLLLRPWGFRPEEIRVPARLEHGDADATVPPRAARRLAERIPDASLELSEGAGHFTVALRRAEALFSAAATVE